MLARNELYKRNYHFPLNKILLPFWINLPLKYFAWNQKWGAPFQEMFSFQGNNVTRYWEYPWAYYAIKLRRGMRVLDFGGGLCGFQFVLAKCGMIVHNVDPGLESKGVGWPVNNRSIQKINKRFKTDVVLHNCFIEKANLASNSFDVIYSISVFEHLTGKELENAMTESARILKPGGYLVMTTDLFPNIYPFTKIKTNMWGTNVSVKKIIEMSGLKMIMGEEKELYGFKQFNPQYILENLHKYFLSGNYPVLTQAVILQKTTNK